MQQPISIEENTIGLGICCRKPPSSHFLTSSHSGPKSDQLIATKSKWLLPQNGSTLQLIKVRQRTYISPPSFIFIIAAYWGFYMTLPMLQWSLVLSSIRFSHRIVKEPTRHSRYYPFTVSKSCDQILDSANGPTWTKSAWKYTHCWKRPKIPLRTRLGQGKYA